MDVPVGAQDYIEQGKKLLLQGQARDAAVAFAHAVKIDPHLVTGHLGLAQANLALGSYGLVHMACRRVQELQPSGPDANLAQALIFVLDRRYDRAVEILEKVTVEDPNRAYAQALRGYCLRQLGQDYEAALAEAKAARIAGSTNLVTLFPKVTPLGHPQTSTTSQEPFELPRSESAGQPPAQQRPPWQPPAQIRRQVTLARFATRGTDVVTFSLIITNVLIYAICGVLAGNIITPVNGQNTLLYDLGIQYTPFILQDHQYWRIITAMFLHYDWLHIGLNMLSLYFIGRPMERLYGPWRFLLIYFGSGVFGGLLVLFLSNAPTLGASGAIFGIFGALGIFLWLNRRSLGSAMIGNWLFWLALNLYFSFAVANIAVSAHIGGLSMGLLLGLLLAPGFWTPVRVQLNRGQTGNALLLVLKPVAIIIAISGVLIALTLLLAGGR